MIQFLRYFLYFVFPITIGFLVFQYLHTIFFKPYQPGVDKMVLVEIADQVKLSDVCEDLVSRGILRQAQSLCLYKQLRGEDAPIVPGEYELSAGMTPAEILRKLQSGSRFKRSVEIQSGETIWEIDESLTDIGLFERHEFETAATNPELLTRAGIASSSFEGYLGPGTYSYSRGVKPARVLWDMLERSDKEFWSQKFSEQIEALRMSRHEILTLASIIHKATSDLEERRLISSTLHNRLKNGMRLNSEEALIYAIRDFSGTVEDSDKALPSPYNTFLNYGLPPGPILNPGLDAIEAALYPPETEYLFYGKKSSGEMVFTTTLKEFKEAISDEDS